ncbi:MAG: endolytic transglycosylase MltG, partial [Thermostichus sp. DG02_5_bins_236]
GSLPDHEKAQTVVNAMLQRFISVALPLFQQHSTPLSLHEWVTLASIVEREAVVPEERALIAGVFLNRLKQGIPLGADPTVEYALNIRQTPDRRLTLAEVRTPSPYNTYLNPGLPPGPIASPGLASLEAVLEPEETDFLYFVARYDGTHVFSKTLAEHEAAQLQIIRERQAGQTTPGAATNP